MKFAPVFVFCFVVSYTTAYAQFKNIKIGELKEALDLMITVDQKEPASLFVTGKSFLYTSTDKGRSWKNKEDPKIIDVVLKNNQRCIGSTNEVYTAFVEGDTLKFEVESKYANPTVIAPFKNGQSYFINGNIHANGLPSIACDLSKGEHHGRVYVCWSDEKYGETNKDVFLAYSDDKGKNWTEPIIITYRPNHKEQFMPYMTVDQSTGFVYILYYDQQNSADGIYTDVYLARSKNGGLLFEVYKINETPILLSNGISLGNRCGLSVVNSVIHPVWLQAGTKNRTSIFTTSIDDTALANYNKNAGDNLVIEKTFIFSDQVKLDFELKRNTRITAVITNPLDHKFEKLFIKNKKMKKGHNSLLIDTKKLGVPKGNYTLTLYYDYRNTYVWIVEE